MTKYKVLLTLALTISLLFVFNIGASAESVSLNNGVTVSANCVDGKPVLSVTNNGDKNIRTIDVRIRQLDQNGPIASTDTQWLPININVGETKQQSIVLYAPKPFTSLEVYISSITYEDWTTWSGATGFDQAKELGYSFTVLNQVSQNKIPQKSNGDANSDKSGVNGLVPFIIFLIIVITLVVFGINRTNKVKRSQTERKAEISETEAMYRRNGNFVREMLPSSDALAGAARPLTEAEIKGMIGEDAICNQIIQYVGGYKQILRNVYIPIGNGRTTEVDVVLLHTSGIYVIESKNFSGYIFGKELDDNWTQTIYNVKTQGVIKKQFYNPIRQNQKHVLNLKNYIGPPAQNKLFYSIIVFGDRAEVKGVTLTSQNARVIKTEGLARVINAFNTIAQEGKQTLSEDEINQLYSIIYPLTQVSAEVKQKHIDDINSKRTL